MLCCSTCKGISLISHIISVFSVHCRMMTKTISAWVIYSLLFTSLIPLYRFTDKNNCFGPRQPPDVITDEETHLFCNNRELINKTHLTQSNIIPVILAGYGHTKPISVKAPYTKSTKICDLLLSNTLVKLQDLMQTPPSLNFQWWMRKDYSALVWILLQVATIVSRCWSANVRYVQAVLCSYGDKIGGKNEHTLLVDSNAYMNVVAEWICWYLINLNPDSISVNIDEHIIIKNKFIIFLCMQVYLLKLYHMWLFLIFWAFTAQ